MSDTSPSASCKQGNSGLKLKIKFSRSKGFVSDFVKESSPGTVHDEQASISAKQSLARPEKSQSDTAVHTSLCTSSRLEVESTQSVLVSRCETLDLEPVDLNLSAKTVDKKKTSSLVTDLHPSHTHSNLDLDSQRRLLEETKCSQQRHLVCSGSLETILCAERVDCANVINDKAHGDLDLELFSPQQDVTEKASNPTSCGQRKQDLSAAVSLVPYNMAATNRSMESSSFRRELVKDNVLETQELGSKEPQSSDINCSLGLDVSGESTIFNSTQNPTSISNFAKNRHKENPLFPWSVNDSTVSQPQFGEYSQHDWGPNTSSQKQFQAIDQFQTHGHAEDSNGVQSRDADQHVGTCVSGSETMDNTIKRVFVVDCRNQGSAGFSSEINNNRDTVRSSGSCSVLHNPQSVQYPGPTNLPPLFPASDARASGTSSGSRRGPPPLKYNAPPANISSAVVNRPQPHRQRQSPPPLSLHIASDPNVSADNKHSLHIHGQNQVHVHSITVVRKDSQCAALMNSGDSVDGSCEEGSGHFMHEMPAPSCAETNETSETSAASAMRLKSASVLGTPSTDVVMVMNNNQMSLRGTAMPLQSQDGCHEEAMTGLLKTLMDHKNRAPNSLREKQSSTKHASLDAASHSLLTGSGLCEQLREGRSSPESAAPQLNRTIAELRKRVEEGTLSEGLPDASQDHASLKQGNIADTHSRSVALDNQTSAHEKGKGSLARILCRCEEPVSTYAIIANRVGNVVTPQTCEICSSCGKLIRKTSEKTICTKKRGKVLIQTESCKWCACEAKDSEGCQGGMCKKCKKPVSKQQYKQHMIIVEWCHCHTPLLGQSKVIHEDSSRPASYQCQKCSKWISKNREEYAMTCDINPYSLSNENPVETSETSAASAMRLKSASVLGTPSTGVVMVMNNNQVSLRETAMPLQSQDGCHEEATTGLLKTLMDHKNRAPNSLRPLMGPPEVMTDHNYSQSPFLIRATTHCQSDQDLHDSVVPDQEAGQPKKMVYVFPPHPCATTRINCYQPCGVQMNNGADSGRGQQGTETGHVPACVPASLCDNAETSRRLQTENGIETRSDSFPSTSSSPGFFDLATVTRQEDKVCGSLGAAKLPLDTASEVFKRCGQQQIVCGEILSPCYVVLERMNCDRQSPSRQSVPPCTVSCRQHALRHLCERGKLQHCRGLQNEPVLKEMCAKRMAVWNRKKDYFRRNKTMHGYDDFRQKEMKKKRLKKRKVYEADVKDSQLTPVPLPSKYAINLRITQKGIQVQQNSTSQDDFQHSDCSFAKAIGSESLDGTCGQAAPDEASSLAQQLDHNKNKQCSLQDSGMQESPESRENDNNWIKVSQFNVKYYVFRGGNRAFVVPLIKRSRGNLVRCLDEEDQNYVKLAINQLLSEADSCARLLQYPDSLQHKGSGKTVSHSANGETEPCKKTFVAPTLGAEDMDIEGLKSLISHRDFSRLVPKNSRISKSKYLQEIGEKVHMYLTGGMEETPEWIKDVAKSIVNKHKRNVKTKTKKRLRPSKDVHIEIDYAQEEEFVDVGEEATDDSIDQSATGSSVLEDSAAAVYEGVDQTNIYNEDSHPTQQTGSFVCEEAFDHEEKKPLLGDMMNVAQSASLSSVVAGQQVMIPLPQECGYEEETASRLSVTVPLPTDNIQEPIPHLSEQCPEQKPLLGELLVAATSSGYITRENHQQSHGTEQQGEQHRGEEYQSAEQYPLQSNWPLTLVKEEPPDEDYSHAWSGQAQSQEVGKDAHHQQMRESHAFPFISNSTFGRGTVQLEDDADCATQGVCKETDRDDDARQLRSDPSYEEDDSKANVPLIACVASSGELAGGNFGDHPGFCGEEVNSAPMTVVTAAENHLQFLPQIVSVAYGEAACRDTEADLCNVVTDPVEAFVNAEETTEVSVNAEEATGESTFPDDFAASVSGQNKGHMYFANQHERIYESETGTVPQISAVAFGDAARLWETPDQPTEQDQSSQLNAADMSIQPHLPVITSVAFGDAVSHLDREESPPQTHPSEPLEGDEDAAEDFAEDDYFEEEESTEPESKYVPDGLDRQQIGVPIIFPTQSSLNSETETEPSHGLPLVQMGVDLSIVKQEVQDVEESSQSCPGISAHVEHNDNEVSPVCDSTLANGFHVNVALSSEAVLDVKSQVGSEDEIFTSGLPGSAQTPMSSSSIHVPSMLDTVHDGQASTSQEISQLPSVTVLDVRSLAPLILQRKSESVIPVPAQDFRTPQDLPILSPFTATAEKSKRKPKKKRLRGSRKKQSVRTETVLSETVKLPQDLPNWSLTVTESNVLPSATCLPVVADSATAVTDAVSASENIPSDRDILPLSYISPSTVFTSSNENKTLAKEDTDAVCGYTTNRDEVPSRHSFSPNKSIVSGRIDMALAGKDTVHTTAVKATRSTQGFRDVVGTEYSAVSDSLSARTDVPQAEDIRPAEKGTADGIVKSPEHVATATDSLQSVIEDGVSARKETLAGLDETTLTCMLAPAQNVTPAVTEDCIPARTTMTQIEQGNTNSSPVSECSELAKESVLSGIDTSPANLDFPPRKATRQESMDNFVKEHSKPVNSETVSATEAASEIKELPAVKLNTASNTYLTVTESVPSNETNTPSALCTTSISTEATELTVDEDSKSNPSLHTFSERNGDQLKVCASDESRTDLAQDMGVTSVQSTSLTVCTASKNGGYPASETEDQTLEKVPINVNMIKSKPKGKGKKRKRASSKSKKKSVKRTSVVSAELDSNAAKTIINRQSKAQKLENEREDSEITKRITRSAKRITSDVQSLPAKTDGAHTAVQKPDIDNFKTSSLSAVQSSTPDTQAAADEEKQKPVSSSACEDCSVVLESAVKNGQYSAVSGGTSAVLPCHADSPAETQVVSDAAVRSDCRQGITTESHDFATLTPITKHFASENSVQLVHQSAQQKKQQVQTSFNLRKMSLILSNSLMSSSSSEPEKDNANSNSGTNLAQAENSQMLPAKGSDITLLSGSGISIGDEDRNSARHKHKLEDLNSEETTSKGSKVPRVERSIFSDISSVFCGIPAPSTSSGASSSSLSSSSSSSVRLLQNTAQSYSETSLQAGARKTDKSCKDLLPHVKESLKEGLVSRLRASLVSLKDGASAKGCDTGCKATEEKSSVPDERSFFDCLPQALKDAWKQ